MCPLSRREQHSVRDPVTGLGHTAATPGRPLKPRWHFFTAAELTAVPADHHLWETGNQSAHQALLPITHNFWLYPHKHPCATKSGFANGVRRQGVACQPV